MQARCIWAGILAMAMPILAACQAESELEPVPEDSAAVLIFSHTTGWRHDSIEAGITALTGLAEEKGYAVRASEDPDVFNEAALGAFDAVILLSSTTGKDGKAWFDGERGEALQAFLRSGKGIVGIHGASDSHYRWPWYGAMIGGWFERHPPGTQAGTLTVVDPAHPATRQLPGTFARTDEWYFIQNFSVEDGLLITLDPATIGEEGGPMPVSWAHDFEGGRVFYTSMGHTKETFEDPYFLDHVGGSLDWATGRASADPTP